MAAERIPDPTLMARLQLSVKGVDWASSLVAHKQHESPEGEWTAHQHLFHVLGVEREVFQPRIRRMLEEDRPTFAFWDEEAHMRERYALEGDLNAMAEEFMKERERTVELFKPLTAEQWLRTATWPQGEVDVAWAAERVVWHALDHFTGLLGLHQKLEKFQARQWMGTS